MNCDSPADVLRRPRRLSFWERKDPSAASPFAPRFPSVPWSYSCQPRLYHALFNYVDIIFRNKCLSSGCGTFCAVSRGNAAEGDGFTVFSVGKRLDFALRAIYNQAMKYFFTLEQDLPAGVGFTLWGREHIAWLCIAAAIGVLLCLSYRRAKAEAQ